MMRLRWRKVDYHSTSTSAAILQFFGGRNQKKLPNALLTLMRIMNPLGSVLEKHAMVDLGGTSVAECGEAFQTLQKGLVVYDLMQRIVCASVLFQPSLLAFTGLKRSVGTFFVHPVAGPRMDVPYMLQDAQPLLTEKNNDV